jgi:hypothetical protein
VVVLINWTPAITMAKASNIDHLLRIFMLAPLIVGLKSKANDWPLLPSLEV